MLRPLALGLCATLAGCVVNLDHSLIGRDRGGDRAALDRAAPDVGRDRPAGESRSADSAPDRARADLLHCTPSAAIGCSADSKSLISCSATGWGTSTVSCPLGCKSGTCCADKDADGYTDCNGDCNDDDARVHPGQTSFYSTASDGSFDYNCDGKVEQEYPDLVNCHMAAGNSCVGDGWQGSVPACGQPGSLVSCKKHGNSCDPDPPTSATQACR